MQNKVLLEAYKIFQKMKFSKTMNEGIKRAIRVRLEVILENEEAGYKWWSETVKHKLNRTRQKHIEREHKKRIQALKIVVYMLTPFGERTTDVPMFIVKKDKNNP